MNHGATTDMNNTVQAHVSLVGQMISSWIDHLDRSPSVGAGNVVCPISTVTGKKVVRRMSHNLLHQCLLVQCDPPHVRPLLCLEALQHLLAPAAGHTLLKYLCLHHLREARTLYAAISSCRRHLQIHTTQHHPHNLLALGQPAEALVNSQWHDEPTGTRPTKVLFSTLNRKAR